MKNNKDFILNLKKKRTHNFQILGPSIWPFTISLLVFFIVIHIFLSMLDIHPYSFICISNFFIILILLIALVYSIFNWCFDVVYESRKESFSVVNNIDKNLRLGFILFIVSEIMFFFSFFWAFFYLSIAPSIFIGCLWPPIDIKPLNYMGLPLANTLTLLLSGVSLTWAHMAVKEKLHEDVLLSFSITIFLGVFFLLLQLYEYLHLPFCIYNGVYASCFYICTGFHGLHVIIGLIMILVSFFRYLSATITAKEHLFFEMSIWYWHFVDVVWLFLYLFLYIWGNWV